MFPDRLFKSLLITILLSLSMGCSSVGYYSQAISGHLKLMRARQPVAGLLASNDTDAELREKLQTLVDARQFAVEQLHLPQNDSYSTYAETGRRYVTWNVIAAAEFSVQARTWCFPVAGCVNYRGYFAEADAESYADGLKSEDYDVTIGGSAAYSTLGWFDDPLLDTMLRGGDIRYVATLFHELSHQLLYIKDDSNYNEAFASFVEQEGMRIWLRDRGEMQRIDKYNTRLQRSEQFAGLLRSTRAELQTLYSKDMPAEGKRLAKAQVFKGMRVRYEKLKKSWQGYAGYDSWFARPLNNARLVSVSTYRRYIPAFSAMFRETGEDLEAFYTLAKSIAELPADERRKKIDAYLGPDNS
jgi:predicted aminopeptidase